MIWVFLGFSILVIPTIMAFKSGSAYEGDDKVGYAGSMVGNLGYSGTECINAPISIGTLAMSCDYGTIGEIFDYGVTNPEQDGPMDACLTNDENKACKPDNKDVADMFAQAIGKDRYSVRFSDSDLFVSPSAGCAGPTNLLFVQYSCIQSEED